jgi:hypothetical protein
MTARTAIVFLSVGLLMLAGCAGPAAQGSAAPPAAVARGGAQAAAGCNIDAMKICQSAASEGTLEAPPQAGGYGGTRAAMPSTARIAIPGGPTVQAMCYYNPQRTALAKADSTVSAPLDANAVAFLKSKDLCAAQ